MKCHCPGREGEQGVSRVGGGGDKRRAALRLRPVCGHEEAKATSVHPPAKQAAARLHRQGESPSDFTCICFSTCTCVC